MATPTGKMLNYGSVQIYSEEVLGIGSYGKVCKAKCGQLPCAAKLLHDTLFQDNDPGTRNLVTKFLQECQFLSTIKHPNIVQYLGTATDPQSRRTVLLMELMDESLTRFIDKSTGPLSYHSQLNICHDVALALAYLHSNAIIHRDLSSNNVLLIGEGSRAKVTDFGMSKLVDMNPRMTPLTQVPGTPAYMPPEALISPPHYSSKLDCFSHGVVTLQIITRNFPNPGDATRYVEDPRYPTGRVSVHYPEIERRKKDIDLIEPSHPLQPIALQCLKDRDTERPSADELCMRLASLKREPRYTHSVEQTRGLIQRLQEEINAKDGEQERARAELQRANEAKEQLQREYEERLHAQELILQKKELERLQDKEMIRSLLEALETEAPEQASVTECRAEQPLSLTNLTWNEGHQAPEDMASYHGAALGCGNIAYFSRGHNVYSYIVPENKWTKLSECKHEDFALARIDDKLTAIGGRDSKRITNTLLCSHGGFFRSLWEEVLPPMPTKRMHPAAANTSTHLVVAGGRQVLVGNSLKTVEVLNTVTFQWSTATSLPQSVNYPQMTTCDGQFYLSNNDNNIFSCNVEDLLNSTDGDNSGSVWTRLARIPTEEDSSLATLRGHVLAIGGADSHGYPTGAIHCYDTTTNSWSVIGEMPTPRSDVLTAVLSRNELVVAASLACYCTTRLL